MLPLQNARDVAVHSGGAVLLHLFRDVSIDIQRKGGGGATEVSLYRLDVIPGADSGDGVTVPQVVESGVRPSNRRDSFLEVLVDGAKS